jgi:hypothetical protein
MWKNAKNWGLSFIPYQSVWYLWWTEWYWTWFHLSHFAFPVSVISPVHLPRADAVWSEQLTMSVINTRKNGKGMNSLCCQMCFYPAVLYSKCYKSSSSAPLFGRNKVVGDTSFVIKKGKSLTLNFIDIHSIFIKRVYWICFWIVCNFVRNCSLYLVDVGRDTIVSIANLYGLGGPRIISRCGRDFCNRPDQQWGPRSLLYNRCGSFLWGQNGRGVALTTHCIQRRV